MDLPTLEEWAERLRAQKTRQVYTYFVRQFLEFHSVTAQETLEWELFEAEDHIIEYREYMVKRGYAGKSIELALAALRRWFWDNRIRVYVKAQVSTEKTYLDYIPSRQDLQILLDSVGKPHLKLAIMLMAFSGMRPVDVVTLRYENVKSSLEEEEEIITILKRHQKTREWYPTFMGPQGTRVLEESLRRRRDKGEKITNKSYIVVYGGKPMTSGSLTKAIQRIIRRTIGVHPTGEPFRRFRPYGLRKYFRRGVGMIGQAEAEFLMGHVKGLRSLEATYSGLRDMDPQAIAILKEKYVKVLPELETELTDAGVRARMKRLVQREEEMDEIKREMAEIKALLALKELKDDEEAQDQ